MSQLVVMLDKQLIKRVDIKQTHLVIGRHPRCDIVLTDRTISAQHAKITLVHEDCYLEDLASTNGTYVNQHLIDRHLLDEGDTINLGKYSLLFHSSQSVENQVKRLSVHPRLVDNQYAAWLKLLNGRREGNIIPILHKPLCLGNAEVGYLIIERNDYGDYVLKQLGEAHKSLTRKLVVGEELEFNDMLLQFQLAEVHQRHESIA
ncbi:MAG: FHA domain-containing protein [Thiotrichaceae bacterium]|jgi:pSer/pThr/pTyr-binding forkhead associated (FHA) protein|uniref:FHA domain-containing protein n=1 Tax=Candidatus Thiocaldithrix dubininis TaxID=3080823 RepID=A0AA95KDK1_9GAMM|nr:MAG: FHA domain-containing protein [Candidatus Thiocaldithrix dubininis]